MNRFTDGDCHILARRIYRIAGWPICSFTYDWSTTDPEYDDPKYLEYGMDAHVFNKHPSGLYIDIEGLHTGFDLADDYGYDEKHIREVPIKYVIYDWGGPCFGHYSYAAARREANRLIGEYPWPTS